QREHVSAQQQTDQGWEGTPLYTVVESRRLRSGKVAQRQVLYLGEINDSQQSSWRRTLEVFDEERHRFTPLSLFPEDRPIPPDAVDSVQVKLSEMKLERARPYGNCWLGCELWRQLQLDRVLAHKQDLFLHLQERWKDLFDAEFDLLLYDLTSTYVEGESEQNPKAKYGYSRDGRPDCKQVVIALVMTPTGLPLAYEVMD